MTEQAKSQTRTRSAGGPPQREAAVTSSREKQAAALPHPPSRAHSDLNQTYEHRSPGAGWGESSASGGPEPTTPGSQVRARPGRARWGQDPKELTCSSGDRPGIELARSTILSTSQRCTSEHSSILSNEATAGGLVQDVEPSGRQLWEVGGKARPLPLYTLTTSLP